MPTARPTAPACGWWCRPPTWSATTPRARSATTCPWPCTRRGATTPMSGAWPSSTARWPTTRPRPRARCASPAAAPRPPTKRPMPTRPPPPKAPACRNASSTPGSPKPPRPPACRPPSTPRCCNATPCATPRARAPISSSTRSWAPSCATSSTTTCRRSSCTCGTCPTPRWRANAASWPWRATSAAPSSPFSRHSKTCRPHCSRSASS